MKKIITHPGRAHLDDYMACALAIYGYRREQLFSDDDCVTIERKEPSQEELSDPDIWVLDVGHVYDPKLHNFDHHQFEGGTKKSAMSLVADYLGIRDLVSKLFPWFETRVVLDSCGPFVAAKEADTDWGTVSRFMGPCEQLVLGMFANAPDSTRSTTVDPMVDEIADKVAAYSRVSKVLVKTEVEGVEVINFIAADTNDVIKVSSVFFGKDGVAVSVDDRGPGLSMMRIKDDPRIDFRRIAGQPGVGFVHANGFLGKTVERDFSKALEFIAASIVR